MIAEHVYCDGGRSLKYANHELDTQEQYQRYVCHWFKIQQKLLPSAKDMVEEDATVKLPSK